MNDDSTHDHPGDRPEGDDALTPEEAAARDALRDAPAPRLSELDRRRLVRSAMEATAPDTAAPRGGGGFARRWMGLAAAAAVLIVVVGVSLLSDRGGSDSSSADGGGAATSADATAENVEGAEDADPATADAGATSVLDLGDLGSFDDDDDVARAFDSAGSIATSSDTSRFRMDTGHAIACAETLPDDVLLIAVGTLTYHGSEAVILGGEILDGGPVAYLLDASDCAPFADWNPRSL